MNRTLCFAISLGVALLVAGCETDGTSAAVKASAATKPATANGPKTAVTLIPASKVNTLVPGMKTDTVKKLLGDPFAVRPFEGEAGAEVWTYRVAMNESVDNVPTSMEDRPTFDPLTNRQITAKEPVYQLQHVRVYQTMDLLMVDGRLIERKPGKPQVDRSFY